MFLYFSSKGIYHLLRRFELCVTQDTKQKFVTKLLLLVVFSFSETVGIYKEWTPLDGIYLFANVFESRPQPKWRIWLHFKEVAFR